MLLLYWSKYELLQNKRIAKWSNVLVDIKLSHFYNGKLYFFLTFPFFGSKIHYFSTFGLNQDDHVECTSTHYFSPPDRIFFGSNKFCVKRNFGPRVKRKFSVQQYCLLFHTPSGHRTPFGYFPDTFYTASRHRHLLLLDIFLIVVV